ncbi:DgyrCDS8978 [Dimorphilus gyrociliatus]|uniref:DgyrCDS8978 n=1 Tax=Dimorphilus gyrociliatus TaxID=2664684 RepID=A0A7I8VW27_9ANNE|nr:DgyrCDS8978 [Dimorphilus gyrociliatus]
MAQPTRPGNDERGWNDPPMFLHTNDGVQPSSTQKRTLLNKRVAYPGITKVSDIDPVTKLQSTEPQMNVVLHPPASTTALPASVSPAAVLVPSFSPTETKGPSLLNSGLVVSSPPPECATKSQVTVPDFEDDVQKYNYITSTLQRFVNDCVAKGKSMDEVSKRLITMQTMWKSDRLSVDVKDLMAKLTAALCCHKYEIAESVHLTLMMDHVSEVNQWMVGIKKLIQESKSLNEDTSRTD